MQVTLVGGRVWEKVRIICSKTSVLGPDQRYQVPRKPSRSLCPRQGNSVTSIPSCVYGADSYFVIESRNNFDDESIVNFLPKSQTPTRGAWRLPHRLLLITLAERAADGNSHDLFTKLECVLDLDQLNAEVKEGQSKDEGERPCKSEVVPVEARVSATEANDRKGRRG